MESTTGKLLADIERFLVRHNMSATTFGIEAINDGHLVRNLRNNMDMRTSTLDRVRLYMADQDKKRGQRRKRRSANFKTSAAA